MPPGVKRIVADSTQLGSIATERLGGPGWVGGPEDIESNIEPLHGRDGFLIRCRGLLPSLARIRSVMFSSTITGSSSVVPGSGSRLSGLASARAPGICSGSSTSTTPSAAAR